MAPKHAWQACRLALRGLETSGFAVQALRTPQAGRIFADGTAGARLGAGFSLERADLTLDTGVLARVGLSVTHAAVQTLHASKPGRIPPDDTRCAFRQRGRVAKLARRAQLARGPVGTWRVAPSRTAGAHKQGRR